MARKRSRTASNNANNTEISSRGEKKLRTHAARKAEDKSSCKETANSARKPTPSSGSHDATNAADENGRHKQANIAGQHSKRKAPINNKVLSSPSKRMCKAESDSESIESDGVEWEDVEEVEMKDLISKQENLDTVTKEPEDTPSEVKNVEISIKVPGKKKGRTREAIQKYIQRTMNRFRKEVQEGMHKVHILMLVAHGFYRNNICNDCFVQAWSLSLVPLHLISLPMKNWGVAELDKFLHWFLKRFSDLEDPRKEYSVVTDKMGKLSMSELFVSLLRAVGFLSRLVLSLQPVALKIGPDRSSPNASQRSKTRDSVGEKRKGQSRDKKSTTGVKCGEKILKTPASKGSVKLVGKTKSVKQEMEPGPSGIANEELNELKALNSKSVKKQGRKVKATKEGKRGLQSEKGREKNNHLRKRKKVNYTCTDSADNDYESEAEDKDMESEESSDGSENDAKHKVSKSKRKKCLTKKPSKNSNKPSTCSNSDSDFEEETHTRVPRVKSTPASNASVSSLGDSVKNKSSKTPKGKGSSRANKVKQTLKSSVVDLIDDDSDFEVSTSPLVRKKLCTTSNQSKSVVQNVPNSNSEEDGQNSSSKDAPGGIDSWAEVYLPYEKKWICVHLESSSVNHPELCESHSTCPLLYVLAFDGEGCVKDLTSRYASNWMSKNRKMRVDANWLAETLLPYKSRNRDLDEDEDAHLQVQQLEKPLPLSITEYKNHPLYVLKRHLLKFEAIYPESATILGFCRSEAVYSRDCVHLLHTREKWLNEALVVKEGEEPYKIVKGRVKRNQPVQDPNSVTIELFGRWQTEQYKPPPAKDGKVPRNEYGNIELFQPSMLPPGTRHVQIPGIQRVARKLGIDCAPAVVGFDFHCGFSHPVIDGVIVCEEFEDTLRDAWREDEQETRRKKEEKRQKRVLDNWKLLVRTLVIREKLKKRYNTEEPKANPDCDEAAENLASVAWPLNIQENRSAVDTEGHCHVFPEKSHKQDSVTGEWTKACACGLTLPFEKM